jgi:hypothetical protein
VVKSFFKIKETFPKYYFKKNKKKYYFFYKKPLTRSNRFAQIIAVITANIYNRIFFYHAIKQRLVNLNINVKVYSKKCLYTYKTFFGEGFLYIRGLFVIFFIDACLTDDEPL